MQSKESAYFHCHNRRYSRLCIHQPEHVARLAVSIVHLQSAATQLNSAFSPLSRLKHTECMRLLQSSVQPSQRLKELLMVAANLDSDPDTDSKATSQHQQPPPQPQQPAHLGGGGGGRAAKAAQQYPMEVAEIKHRLKAAGAQLPVERFSNAELLRYGHACGLLKVSQQHRDKATGLSWIEHIAVSEAVLFHHSAWLPVIVTQTADVFWSYCIAIISCVALSCASSMYPTHHAHVHEQTSHTLCAIHCATLG